MSAIALPGPASAASLSETVAPHAPHHGRPHAEPRQTRRHVGGRAPELPPEGPRDRLASARARFEHVPEDLAEADDVEHGSA